VCRSIRIKATFVIEPHEHHAEDVIEPHEHHAEDVIAVALC